MLSHRVQNHQLPISATTTRAAVHRNKNTKINILIYRLKGFRSQSPRPPRPLDATKTNRLPSPPLIYLSTSARARAMWHGAARHGDSKKAHPAMITLSKVLSSALHYWRWLTTRQLLLWWLLLRVRVVTSAPPRVVLNCCSLVEGCLFHCWSCCFFLFCLHCALCYLLLSKYQASTVTAEQWGIVKWYGQKCCDIWRCKTLIYLQ